MLNTIATTAANNPFAMLLDLEQVCRAVERSERLNRLHSRICRPLDKPLLAQVDANSQGEFDALIDAAGDELSDELC